MLDYNLINNKPTITIEKDNESVEYIDLLARIYNGAVIQGGRLLKVEKYYIARPDLISLAVYGNDKYADIICKVNGISNPFELNEGMILYLPSSSTLDKCINGTSVSSDILDEFTFENKYINNKYSSSKINTTTEETIEKSKKNLQKYKNERRSPGEQTVNDNNYVIDRSLGLVIY